MNEDSQDKNSYSFKGTDTGILNDINSDHLSLLLIINAGSSSIKFGLYSDGDKPDKILSGQINRIGLPNAGVTYTNVKTGKSKKDLLPAGDYSSTVEFLINGLQKQIDFKNVTAIGHRVVHGMRHTSPTLVTPGLLKDLKQVIPYDPDHLPNEIKLIEAFQKHHPEIGQYACFDTNFHQTMPQVAKQLPIPRRFEKQGIHRYGFHGLSYNYLMNELEKLAGKKAAMGRVILAHLGSGASVAAVFEGKSIDTTMGFTPAGGLPMSSRPGDLDPGVAWVMMKNENLSPEQFSHIINHESGLLGISETSGDMNDLLQQQATDKRSAEAVSLFCYQVKKWIGAYAAALGGVDFLVFAGGIGENSPVIRARVCEGMSFLGIQLDETSNNENAPIISANEIGVVIRVIPTNEELMIAMIVSKLLLNNKTR